MIGFFVEPSDWKDARKLNFWGVRDQGELTQRRATASKSMRGFLKITQ